MPEEAFWQGSPTGSTWTLQLSNPHSVDIYRVGVARTVSKRLKWVFFVGPRNLVAQNTT